MSQASDRIPCPECRANNFPSSTVCWQCGEPLRAQQNQPPTGAPPGPEQPPTGYGAPATRPPNYLVWSILATLFCCLPFGIVAIIYAAQVDSKYSGGDYAGALDASNRARIWSWVSFAAGLVGIVIYVIIALAAGCAGLTSL